MATMERRKCYIIMDKIHRNLVDDHGGDDNDDEEEKKTHSYI